MINVPKRYSYIEVYITLRCNKNCTYCINLHSGVERQRKELSTKEWILAINNINSELPITFGGGEPTIHNGFYEVVAGLKPELKIDLLTNMTFDVKKFMSFIPPEKFTQNKDDEYKSIRASYHPKTTDPDELITKAKTLDDSGYRVGIFGINHPENLQYNVIMTEKCRKARIYFFIRDFLGFYNDRLYGYYKRLSALNGNRKSCMCKTEELLIGPDGNAYRCHRDLYDGNGEIGNILNMAFDIKDEFRSCNNYGLCNPCDVKLKLGPDLITSKCSVEIENE